MSDIDLPSLLEACSLDTTHQTDKSTTENILDSYRREDSICAFCKHNVPLRKCRCGAFLKKKKKVAPSYIASSLDSTEEDGFCAGGIVPYFVDKNGCKHFLLLNETRSGVSALNFAAGGRESKTELDSNKLLP